MEAISPKLAIPTVTVSGRRKVDPIVVNAMTDLSRVFASPQHMIKPFSIGEFLAVIRDAVLPLVEDEERSEMVNAAEYPKVRDSIADLIGDDECVVYIEDDKDMLKITRSLLESEGKRDYLESFINYEEACAGLEIADGELYALIDGNRKLVKLLLLDLQAPPFSIGDLVRKLEQGLLK